MVYAPKGLSAEERLRWTGWVETSTGCWDWSGSDNGRGYGHLWFGGRLVRASRLAYRTWVGRLSEDEVVRHTCDNSMCINPNHFLKGTQVDNMRDRDSRNRRRAPRGELNGRAKLTQLIVNDVRERVANGERVTDIATALGVTVSAVSHIKNGVTWTEEDS